MVSQEMIFDNIGISEVRQKPRASKQRRGRSQKQVSPLADEDLWPVEREVAVRREEADRYDSSQLSPCGVQSTGLSRGPGSSSVTMSFGCVRDMRRGTDQQERMKCHIYLKSFLRSHGFRGVNRAHPVGGGRWFAGFACCFAARESVYPIHIAAQKGDFELVKILLTECADVDKETLSHFCTLFFSFCCFFFGGFLMFLVLLLRPLASGRRAPMAVLLWTLLKRPTWMAPMQKCCFC